MLKKQFESIWNQLRSKKAQLDDYLDDVRIQNIRGISDLKIAFPYPVMVLAGPNACGKSTVLFSCACLYDAKGSDQEASRRYPSDLFPGFKSEQEGVPSDPLQATVMEFSFVEGGKRQQMRWARSAKGKWNKSFFGAKNARQPKRLVYIRTLASLTNPGEVRSLLQMGRQTIAPSPVPASLLAFAHRILPRRYNNLALLESTRRDLLFAFLEDGSQYSEFHMSSGERAILRLSREISGLQDALVLIDEVDVGLHPFTQQQLMLELQRLALRQNLQIVVTSHSPIILESVPVEGRVFLERVGDNVVQRETFRDILQRAMYGRPLERLSVLCEDKVAKAIVQGVMDDLAPRLGLAAGDLDVGHDTGKDEFPQHIRTLARFHQLDSFLFILDGDGRGLENQVREAANQSGQSIRLFFLPGQDGPEQWVWERLQEKSDLFAERLGIAAETLRSELRALAQSFAASTDKKPEVAKQRLQVLVEGMGRELTAVCREVSRHEASADDGTLIEFRDMLHDAIRDWRSQSGND